jgi:hypothetical protein
MRPRRVHKLFRSSVEMQSSITAKTTSREIREIRNSRWTDERCKAAAQMHTVVCKSEINQESSEGTELQWMSLCSLTISCNFIDTCATRIQQGPESSEVGGDPVVQVQVQALGNDCRRPCMPYFLLHGFSSRSST